MHSPSLQLGIFFLFLGGAAAQVASHAPTVFTPAPNDPSSRPVARVNGSILTAADLTREEYAIFPYAKQHGGIPKEMDAQIRDGAMKMMVFEELVYQEALRRKLTIAPARLQRAEAEFRNQFASLEQYRAFLQSDFHGSSQLLKEKIRRSLLIEQLLKTEVEAKSIVTPAELRAYYNKNAARFQLPESYTFQTISVLPPANATPDQLKEGKTRAERSLQKAKATKTSEEFGLLAEKMSDDDYRVMMGQHKPVPVDQLAPQVLKALAGMKPGDVSGLIQLDQAYTIVRLQQHTPAGQQSFESVKAQLQKELHQARQNQLRSALDKKLRQGAKVEEL